MTPPPDAPRRPADLGDRALDNLSFIRDTMERATAFTGVPGWGGVAMGATAVAAAVLAAGAATPGGWLGTWLAEAVLAFLIGAWSLGRKSRRQRFSTRSRPVRQFFLSFFPPLAVGVLLTVVLWRSGLPQFLPGTWLLLYGTAVVTGGAFSVRAVPLMGAVLMAIGAAAILWPAWGDLAMGTGFGAVQIGFGWYIARRHGG